MSNSKSLNSTGVRLLNSLVMFFRKVLFLSTVQNSMFARLGTDYEIRNLWFFATLETMTTD